MTKIVIVGGGIIGATLAYWLVAQQAEDHNRAGLEVTLIEANPDFAYAGTASAASAGIISPDSNLNTPPALLALTQRSLALYPKLAAELKLTQPDFPTGFLELGQLSLAANNAEVRGLQKRLQWFAETKTAPSARWLSPEEVQQLEPYAGPNAGALYQSVYLVRPSWLTPALIAAAVQKGLKALTNSPVKTLLTSNSLKVRGVELENGETILADKVVIAAGSWSGSWLDQQLINLGLRAVASSQGSGSFATRIYPVRGQMLSVQLRSDQPPLRHVLVGGHGYAIPRTYDSRVKGGQIENAVAFGATEEHKAGFEVQNTPEGLRELSLLVHKLTPTLEKAPIKELWAGLRPGTDANLPLLGPVAALKGLWLASGHFRSGVLLAPATAELLTAALLDETATAWERLQPFSLTLT